MKILYIAQKYDYGKPERGFSFEHYNFFDSLVKMNNHQNQVIYFPFDEIMLAVGRDEMNRKLLSVVEQERPEVCFFFLFAEEIKKETIKKITEAGGSITFNWFADDHWRFESFSKYYAPCFHFFSTTDSEAVEKYKKIGLNNVFKTQWGCNHFLYKPLKSNDDLSMEYEVDVSFVGQPHGNRKGIISKISMYGAPKPECFGFGWPNGKVSQERMIELFCKSKINLNLTKGSIGWTLKGVGHVFFKRKSWFIVPQYPGDIFRNIKMFFSGQREQIKGRNFEVPGSGGFMLTGNADNISEYYENGKEIVIYTNVDDLSKKILYYLNNEKEREKIRRAGYERTIREHTYERRFNEIFDFIKKFRNQWTSNIGS